MWDDDDDTMTVSSPSGLSVSEDEKNVYVEASMPGLDAKDIEVTFDKGVVWVKGEAKEEEKNKKYYRRASRSFSYRVAVPGEVNPDAEPEATYKNGVMTVTFAKSPKKQPKKIAVKATK
jgi:HSP20 family protein